MKRRDEKGFTLIELMIVIAIIGILAAIAIPNFNAYRAKSYNASANSDVRNLITSLEGYFVDYDKYPQHIDGANVRNALEGYGYIRSSGVTNGDIDGNDTAYTIDETWNSKAGDRAVTYTIRKPEDTEITKIIP